MPAARPLACRFSGLPTSTPASSPEGTPLALSASVSNPVGDYSYQWSVTEGTSTTPVASGVGSTFDFTPESSGSYTVSLSASDAYGQTLSSSGAFSATPVAPSAIFSAGPPTVLGDEETFTASFSNAYDPTEESSDIKYAFGYAAGSGPVTSYGSSGTASSSNFAFSSPGVYTIGGEVINQEGQSTSYQETVNVGDPSGGTNPLDSGPTGAAFPVAGGGPGTVAAHFERSPANW